MISFNLPIEPVAWQRVKRGRYGQAYVPGKTRRFETDLKKLVRALHRGAPIDGALSVRISFFLGPPKRKVRDYPSVRPDLSNFIKSCEDALNGVLWHDDGQIVKLETQKFYDWTNKTGRIEIAVEQLEEL